MPKPFATVKAVDTAVRTVTLLLDGEKEPKVWPVEPDAEIKVGGWWGRLGQIKPGDRVWAWLKLDRKKSPVSVVMLADETSEFDMHGGLKPEKDQKPKLTPEQVEAARTTQKAWLRKLWAEEGLPGTLTFHHVFSGELELALDELESVGLVNAVPLEFWHTLRSAAERMGLRDYVARLAVRTN